MKKSLDQILIYCNCCRTNFVVAVSDQLRLRQMSKSERDYINVLANAGLYVSFCCFCFVFQITPKVVFGVTLRTWKETGRKRLVHFSCFWTCGIIDSVNRREDTDLSPNVGFYIHIVSIFNDTQVNKITSPTFKLWNGVLIHRASQHSSSTLFVLHISRNVVH